MTSLLCLGLIFLVVCSFITSYQRTQKSKYLKQKNAVASIWREIMLAHLSSEIICSSFVAYSFYRVSPWENYSHLGTNNVRGQEKNLSRATRDKSSQLIFSCRERITEYIFTPNGGYCLFSLGLYLPLVWVESNSCRPVKI